ncbi:MAG: hypothetical protein JST06_05025 [Bacteroidetes bacterium]|nr:hypothetical protein [Bacteroidota bacterium]MBS1630780.1 hypothetical protein [Bacteroidota bacterium]
MNKTKYTTLGLALSAMLFSACSGNSSQQVAHPADTGTTVNTQLPAAPHTDTIEIKGMAFNPGELTISKGDSIFWINHDIVAHNVTQFPQGHWKSPLLQPGDHFIQAFDDSASYYCSIHPTMRGKFLIK